MILRPDCIKKINLEVIVVFIILISGFVISQTYSSSYGNTYSSSLGYDYYNTNTNYYSSYSDYSNRNDNGSNIYGSSVNPQFYPAGYSGFSYNSPQNYWSGYGSESCIAEQDLVLIIPPGGCKPSVVRSDLLEEQNVPVFCKVSALQINPLIDISKIRSLRFSGEYPKGVSGVSYFPARASIGNKQIFQNSIFEDNLGYLVVVLTRTEAEKDMPDFVDGNITATVDYLSEGAFGIGDSKIYLTKMNDLEWASEYKDYGFWNGRGYVRVESIENNKAMISIYRDADTKQATVVLGEGETSGNVFLSGFYCAAGLKVKVDKIGYPVDSALIQVNDEQIWVTKGDKILNDKCRIIDLKTSSGGGTVKISCPGNKAIELSLTSGKAIFSSSEKDFSEFGIGERVKENTYLGYLGQDSNGKRYAILVEDNFSSSENFVSNNIPDKISKVINEKMTIEEIQKKAEKTLLDYYKGRFNLEEKELKEKIKVYVVKEGGDNSDITLNEVNIAKDRVWDYGNLTEQQILAKEYYDTSISEYEDLIDIYPNEKMDFIEEDPYAAKSLLEAAQMSRIFGMDEKSYGYYQRLMKDYPNSNSARTAQIERKNILKYDTKNSKTSVSIMNENYFIDLLDFKKPSVQDLSAVLLIGGKETTLSLNEIKLLNKKDSVYSFKLTDIKDDFVEIEFEEKNSSKTFSKNKQKLDLKNKNQVKFGEINVRLVKINLNSQVKITLLANDYGPRVQSKFRFKIGIEKRAIQISPEKAKEMMESLEKSIKEIQDINKKLGEVVKGLKGACFATSAILTTKNIINGKSGEALARSVVMTNNAGWNKKCEELVNQGKYSTVHQCLLSNSDQVEKDVQIYSKNIDESNKLIKNIQDKHTTSSGIFSGDQINTKKVDEEFKTVFSSWCKQNNDKITLPTKDKAQVELGTGNKSICGWETLTSEQRRDIMTLYKTQNSGGSETLKNVTSDLLGKTLLEAKNYHDQNEERIRSDKEASENNLGIKTTEPNGDPITQGFVKTITITDDENKVYKNFKDGEKVVRIFIPRQKTIGGEIIFELNKSVADEIGGQQVVVEVEYSRDDNYYYPKEGGKVYRVDGKAVSSEAAKEVRRYMSLAGINKIKQSDQKAYENRMLNPEKLRVKYFEKVPYKGLPAEVPFDVENGWYAEMTYVLSGFGKPYDESGRVVNFYICNVGQNGLIEFKQSADDICRYYNSQNSNLDFPGMSSAESSKLVNNAIKAIQEAAKQYGKKRVTVNGRSFETGTSFGGEEGRCTDFMSVKDCTLLFNVCDPVICPASRCDYGGKYRVDDVIQSGIAGSLILCLPNIKDGVIFPICLSGVYAGLDAYASILNSTAQCLNESISTGKNIGICDEIKSIYLCEFFWRQAAPLAEIALPSFFESISGQGVRGGGEYLTVQSSWDNTKNAMSYFTQVYAQNSISAFNSRSLEDAGTDFGIDICKSFISGDFSGIKNLFENLIEPDSPVQYHAWFSENTMTDATVPPTSHYKVYYHIYAGKDSGIYYKVYLKDVPKLGYAQTTGYYLVDSGYITRGSQVDRARDFIAVSGFKQLCINVNGKDECGFGEVTTSYALNSLTESYVSKQITTGISSEKECVAGTPSFGSLVNPNLQAGVEELLNPQLYNEGIVRVCASENPGKRVLASGEYDRTNSSYDKWKDVGYCDDPEIRCWLDTQSVKEVIVDKGIENQVLGEINESYVEGNNYWTYEQSRVVADKSEDFINALKITKDDNKDTITEKIRSVVKDLRKLSELGITNVHRARAHYLIGRLYKKVAENLWTGEVSTGGVFVYGGDYVAVDYPEDLGEEVTSEEDSVSSAEISSSETTSSTASSYGGNENLIDSGYFLDSESRILKLSGGKEIDSEFYIKKLVYTNANEESSYLIYHREKALSIDILWPDKKAGSLVKNVVVINKDFSDNKTAEELNSLYLNFKNNKFYKIGSN